MWFIKMINSLGKFLQFNSITRLFVFLKTFEFESLHSLCRKSFNNIRIGRMINPIYKNSLEKFLFIILNLIRLQDFWVRCILYIEKVLMIFGLKAGVNVIRIVARRNNNFNNILKKGYRFFESSIYNNNND